MTATINSEYKIKDWLKVGTTNQIEKYNVRSVSSQNEYGSLFSGVMLMDPLNSSSIFSRQPATAYAERNGTWQAPDAG